MMLHRPEAGVFERAFGRAGVAGLLPRIASVCAATRLPTFVVVKRVRFVALVSLAALPSPVPAQTFSAGSFSGWQTMQFLTNPGSSATWSVSNTGNPGSCARVVATHTNSATYFGIGLVGIWNPAFVWDPALDGPIKEVTMSMDARLITQSGVNIQAQQVGVFAVQAGRGYVGLNAVTGRLPSWHQILTPTSVRMSELKFPYQGGTPALLDWSVSGQPISFGFVVGNTGGSLNQSSYSATTEHDNYSLLVIPRGQFSVFGRGCAGSNGQTPTMGNDNFPGLGFRNFCVTVSNAPPMTHAALEIGFSQLQSPIRGAMFGAPGCDLLIGPNVAPASFPLTNASGEARTTIAIPNVQALVRVTFYTQWVVLDLAANALGLTTSDAGAATIE